jgi:hypothetical protein
MNLFESLAENDAFASALLGDMPVAKEEPNEPTQEAYRQVWNEAAAAIAAVYEEGTGTFIREHHPELAKQIRQAGEEVDLFWDDLNFVGFRDAVARRKDLYLEGVKLFARAGHAC